MQNQINARAAQIVAEAIAHEEAHAAKVADYQEWFDYMVNVERIRPETLPCIHGTAMWPDRGQVCGACEYEAEDAAYDDRTPEQVAADRWAGAVRQAKAEAESAAVPVDAWMAPF